MAACVNTWVSSREIIVRCSRTRRELTMRKDDSKKREGQSGAGDGSGSSSGQTCGPGEGKMLMSDAALFASVDAEVVGREFAEAAACATFAAAAAKM